LQMMTLDLVCLQSVWQVVHMKLNILVCIDPKKQ